MDASTTTATSKRRDGAVQRVTRVRTARAEDPEHSRVTTVLVAIVHALAGMTGVYLVFRFLGWWNPDRETGE